MLKGAALIIIGAPQSSLSEDEWKSLDQQLHQNKLCALLVQFGKQDQVNTKNFRNFRLMHFNLANEFDNQFFAGAFEKILIEFERLVEQNSDKSN